MTKEFTNFWKIEFDSGHPKVHPKDREWMEKHWPVPLAQLLYANSKEYVAGDRFGKHDNELHLSLIPTPYLGNLENAKILLFLMNTGFGRRDYHFEDQPEIRERLKQNLHQQFGGAFPFIFLDQRLSESDGAEWWKRRLRPLLEDLIKRGRSTNEAMELMSNKIAAVELFPYHSVDTSEVKGLGKLKILPSVLKAREFFAHSSQSHEKLTVLLRAHRKWAPYGWPENSEYHQNGPRQQTISLDPKYDTGKKILEWLER